MNTVTRLTPPGRGAVAVLRVRMSDATPLDSCFQSVSGLLVATADVGRVLYGHWGPEDLLVVRTGPQEWEIHCHGGNAAVDRIGRDLQHVGCRSVENFSEPVPAVVEHRDDASTVHSEEHNAQHQDSPQSERQNQGAQRAEHDPKRSLPSWPTSDSRAVDDIHLRLQARLTQCRSRRTAEICLAQADVLPPFLASLVTLDMSAACDAVRQFLAWESFAVHLTQSFRVAIVGQPNAGKSSLLNALVGYERAIVFEQPGTTRDLVEAEVFADGWAFQLVDTAGIRETADAVESSGVEAARRSLASSDACLLVVDATAGWQSEDSLIAEQIAASTPVCVLWNKQDLLEPGATAATPPLSRFLPAPVSAVTSSGLEEVVNWMVQTLVPEVPDLRQPLPVISSVNDCLRSFLETEDLQQLRTKLGQFL